MTDRERIIEACKQELGYKESPAKSNKTKYGEWYGSNGVAWCAIFVSWIYSKCNVKFPKRIETEKGFKWVPTMYIRAKQNNWITIDPEPGDIVLFDWEGDKEVDHVGIFDCWIEKGKTFKAYEGNTSLNNDSNGGEVMHRQRKISQVQAFVTVL
jgi:cell wall-associated NlpC family hydrolase